MESREQTAWFCMLAAEMEGLNFNDLVQQLSVDYHIKEFKLEQLKGETAVEMYGNIQTKSFKATKHSELNWWENELRIFVWALVGYSKLRCRPINQLKSSDWEYFSRLFPYKRDILFEYQCISISKDQAKTRKWSLAEDQVFKMLIQQCGLKSKWSEVAKYLYIKTDRKYFRTPKQCRERWLNHLDPAKSKSDWTPQEDLALVNFVMEKGKKWADIVRALKGTRNEHSIKNRFKSILTKEEKAHACLPLSQRQLMLSLERKLLQAIENGSKDARNYLSSPILSPLDESSNLSSELVSNRFSMKHGLDTTGTQPETMEAQEINIQATKASSQSEQNLLNLASESSLIVVDHSYHQNDNQDEFYRLNPDLEINERNEVSRNMSFPSDYINAYSCEDLMEHYDSRNACSDVFNSQIDVLLSFDSPMDECCFGSSVRNDSILQLKSQINLNIYSSQRNCPFSSINGAAFGEERNLRAEIMQSEDPFSILMPVFKCHAEE